MDSLKLIPLEEHKKIIIDILKDIKQVCDENEIIYYIVFGTALGAVRHKGFIPWDDDIDIAMNRENYNKFCSVYKSRSHYRLLNIHSDKEFDAPLPKVIDTDTILEQTLTATGKNIGLYVDIFIFDNIPDSELTRKIFLMRLTFLQKCWAFIRYKRDYKKLSITGILYSCLSRIFSPRFFVKKLDRIAQKFNQNQTQKIGSMTFCDNRFKYIYDRDWFEEGTLLQFENDYYCGPKEYHKFLKCVYGDYMKLPPIEKQKSEHVFKAYYK